MCHVMIQEVIRKGLKNMLIDTIKNLLLCTVCSFKLTFRLKRMTDDITVWWQMNLLRYKQIDPLIHKNPIVI